MLFDLDIDYSRSYSSFKAIQILVHSSITIIITDTMQKICSNFMGSFL